MTSYFTVLVGTASPLLQKPLPLVTICLRSHAPTPELFLDLKPMNQNCIIYKLYQHFCSGALQCGKTGRAQ